MLLVRSRDRWDYYKEYLESCFELLKQQHVEQDQPIFTLNTCLDFLLHIIESSTRKTRGPYLARLELHQRMRAKQLPAQELIGDFDELIIEYFNLFGDKSCCTHDIALFLPSISMEQRQSLANKLLLESGISSNSLPQNVSNAINYLYIYLINFLFVEGAHAEAYLCSANFSHVWRSH